MRFTTKPQFTAVTVGAAVVLLVAALYAFVLEADALPVFGTTIPNGETVPCPSSSGMPMNNSDQRTLHGVVTHTQGCSSEGFCLGLGHLDCGGGMAEDKIILDDGGAIGAIRLNPFGDDYRANGYAWTKALCELDSDGDGFTNGEELGDPCCVWSSKQDEGAAAAAAMLDSLTGFSPSHPGVSDSVLPTGFAYDKASLCSGGDGVTSGGRKNNSVLARNSANANAYWYWYATLSFVAFGGILWN